MARHGTSETIANIFTFLATGEAIYVTGSLWLIGSDRHGRVVESDLNRLKEWNLFALTNDTPSPLFLPAGLSCEYEPGLGRP
jgi:hypothetical protein